MNKKIDIYVNGIYVCSTVQAKNCVEAKNKFLVNPAYMGVNGVTKINSEDIHTVKCETAS